MYLEAYESTQPQIIDRYTIYFFKEDETGITPAFCVTTDGRPDDPRGIYSHSDFDLEQVGMAEKRISVLDLPTQVCFKLLVEMEREA